MTSMAPRKYPKKAEQLQIPFFYSKHLICKYYTDPKKHSEDKHTSNKQKDK
jgi:hypothetical protein